MEARCKVYNKRRLQTELFLLKFEESALGNKSYLKPCELKVDEPYKVLRFWKHGHVDNHGNQALLATLTDGKHLILPRRLSEIVDSDFKLKQINKQSYSIVYKGFFGEEVIHLIRGTK